MKLNNYDITNALMNSAALIILYLIFPILPIYVLIPLVIIVALLPLINKEGTSIFIIVMYTLFSFISTLGNAVVIILPTLIATFLTIEPSFMSTIAIISWALLFTPFYWLSIPLSITPSITKSKVRSTVTYISLLLNYIVAQSSLGIAWTPITQINMNKANLVSGIYSIFNPGGLSVESLINELSNPAIYYMAAILIIGPLIANLLLSRIYFIDKLNNDFKQVIDFVTPEILTAVLLYIPTLFLLKTAYSPFIIIGSIIMGGLLYGINIAEGAIGKVKENVHEYITIPIFDHLMLMEYNNLFRKMIQHDTKNAELLTKALDIVNNKDIAIMYMKESPEKLELIGKALLGATMSKGLILMGRINQVSSDVWNYAANQKATLILIPSKIGRGTLSQLRRYGKHYNAGILILTNNYESLVKNALRNNIKVLMPIQPSIMLEGKLTKELTSSKDETSVKREETKVVEQPTAHAESISEQSINKAETPMSASLPSKPSASEVKGKDSNKNSKAKIVINASLDPLDLIHENVKSKLIDYVDSAVRLKDMIKELGIPTVSTILLIGPPKSGKTALVNYVAKQLGISVIDYKDPSITIVDNAIIHIPSLEELIDKSPRLLDKLVEMVRNKHMALIIESNEPWKVESLINKDLIDKVVVVEPTNTDSLRDIVYGKLRLNDETAKYVLSILSTCPPVEAVEKLRQLSNEDVDICSWNVDKYREFALSFKSLK